MQAVSRLALSRWYGERKRIVWVVACGTGVPHRPEPLLAWPPMDGPRPTSAARRGVIALVLLLLAGAVFFGGGSGDSSVMWIGVAAVIGACGCAVAGGIRLPDLDRAGRVAVGACASLVVWTGISIAWSVAGDRSWVALNKGILYGSFLLIGLLLGALGIRTTRTIASLLAAVLGCALAWALAGKAIPALAPSDILGVVRLQSPVGYANGLALLADASVALGLWLAVRGRGRAREAGTLLVYLAVLVVLLTSSRAGVLGALLAAGLWLWLERRRFEGALVAVGAAVPAAAVAGWAFTRPALVDGGQTHADRVSDGVVFGVLAVLGAVAAVAVVRWLPLRLAGRERVTVRVLAVTAFAAVLVGAGLVAVTHRFSGGECVNDPGHIGSLCANNRLHWWREAARIFVDRPLGGAGAGTFEIARTQVRHNADFVSEPHSVPLQVLAGTGIVGGVLLAVLVAGAGIGIVRSLRRLGGEERSAAAALTAFPVVYAMHALVDFDLDFVALTAPLSLVVGVLLAAGRPVAGVRPMGPRSLVPVGLALAASAAFVLPWLAQRSLDSAGRSLDSGRLAQAVSDANRARALDPLLAEPLYTLGEAAAQAGDLVGARARFQQATRLQPENTATWFALGQFEFLAAKNMCAAYRAFNHAYTLDPNGSEWTKGGELDQARDAVNNDHACGNA